MTTIIVGAIVAWREGAFSSRPDGRCASRRSYSVSPATGSAAGSASSSTVRVARIVSSEAATCRAHMPYT